MDIVRVIELSAIGIIFFFGVICNCIVIRSITLTRSMRNAIPYNIKNDCVNLLVMNLAITDLLTLLVSIPMDVVPEHISWPYGTFVCKFISPIQDICLTASALTFSAIAVERYLVSRGVAHRGARNAKLIIGVIWFVSWITMGLPMGIYKKIIEDEGRLECDVIWPNEGVGRFFLYYMIALIGACAIIGALAYCGIRRSLTKVQEICLRKERTEEQADDISEDSLAEQVVKISNLICVLISVFVICVFPFPLFVLLVETRVLADFKYNYVIYLATSCLLYGNCLANPLILMFMSRDARSAIVENKNPPRRNGTDRIRLADV